MANEVPKAIFGYCYQNKSLDIRYDKDVDEKDKIPGLVEYLNYEYEQLLESKGSFILYDDLSEDVMKPIPVVLSSKCPMDKRYRMNDDWVAKTIIRELQEEHYDEKKKEIIKRILKDRSFQPRISGMYFPNKNQILERDCDDSVPQGPYIELYYRNTFCPNEEDYKAWLSACLAHEYFHFLQDSYFVIDFSKKKLKKQVVESTAEFFSFAYSLYKAEGNTHRHMEKEALGRWAESRSNTWRYRFGSEWPYAFAYCFFYGNNYSPMAYSYFLSDYKDYGCIEKFNTVMELAKSSMQQAYTGLTWNVQFD